MAKIKQGILGGFSGSVANVVGSSWKGIPVMKSKPLSVANPQTPKQMQQRRKFKAASATAAGCKNAIIKPFWDKKAQYMTGVNAFMKENVKNYKDNGDITFGQMVFSKGKIGATPAISAILNAAGDELTVLWDESDIPVNGSTDDEVCFVALAADGTVVGVVGLGNYDRSDSSASVPINKDLKKLAEDLVMLFMSKDGKNQSMSSENLITREH
jgi:hypothetical protein